MDRTDRLVWMDLEMTGLDPDRDRILEIAVLVTSAELEVVAVGPDLVLHQDESVLGAMDEWNRSHHGASGLLERCRASTTDEHAAEQQILAFLREHVPERAAPLAGNSIHHDRRFVARHLPAVDRYLHYRIVDVSTVKELGRRWYPEIAAQAPKKRSTHRALDDVLESIEELRFWRDAIFRPRA
ncbi:MAG: oligoribonuclease [Myxococcota bacterium]|nr:oligoribonuclease [Myxococcota bacterium]MDW8363038.1 oligoribonuclease [Myxococcales bacterium]